MKPLDAIPDPLRALIDAALNESSTSGAASDRTIYELESLLRGNRDAQRLFLNYCQLHVDLAIDSHADHALAEVRRLLRDKTLAAPVEAKVEPEPVAAPLGAPPATPGFPLPGAGMIGLMLSLVVLAVAVLMTRPKLIGEDGAASGHLEDRVVKQDDPAPGGSAVPDARPTVIRLESGTAELALPNTGTVVIQGPAEFELLSPTRARLNRGRVKVRITEEKARGFVVETPKGDVIDLGTEFGLDVADDGKTGVVVFEGAVDLRVPEFEHPLELAHVERLVEGEGVVVNDRGELARIMAIVTGDVATFQQSREPSSGDHVPVILDVRDNLRTRDTKKFYEIVARGLNEDARAYVDRPEHEWNGVSAIGLPEYLLGADYIKTFNDDKERRGFEMSVTLARPARLFVFFDDRLSPPEWLVKQFRDTGDEVGLDFGPYRSRDGRVRTPSSRDKGPGKFDFKLSVWERVVEAPGEVVLGDAGARNRRSTMYGVAAIPLDALPAKPPAAAAAQPAEKGVDGPREAE